MDKTENLIEKIIKYKKKISILNNLDDMVIKEIVTNVKFLQYQKNEIIVKEGEYSEDIYFLINGKCKVYVKEDIEVSTISQHQVFGEFSPITKEPRSATIKTVEPCIIIKFNIDLEKLDQKLNSYGLIYKNISKELIRKIDVLNLETALSKIIY